MYISCGDGVSKIEAVKTEEIEVNLLASPSVCNPASAYYEACFKSQMDEYLYPGYCNLAVKRGMYYLEVYENGEFVSRISDLIPIVRKIEKSDYMVVYSIKTDAEFDRVWENSILPYLDLSFTGHDITIKNGIIYSRFPIKSEFSDLQSKLNSTIHSLLRLLYSQGFIVLTGSEKMIQLWKLEPFLPGSPLYKATWRNDLFAPNMVKFLLDIDTDGRAVINICHSEILVCSSIEEAEEAVEEFFG